MPARGPPHALPPLRPAPRHACIPSSDFEFDRVLGPAASQSDVYHAAVKPIVEDVLNGCGVPFATVGSGAGQALSLELNPRKYFRSSSKRGALHARLPLSKRCLPISRLQLQWHPDGIWPGARSLLPSTNLSYWHSAV